jgi:hypothetical protein
MKDEVKPIDVAAGDGKCLGTVRAKIKQGELPPLQNNRPAWNALTLGEFLHRQHFERMHRIFANTAGELAAEFRRQHDEAMATFKAMRLQHEETAKLAADMIRDAREFSESASAAADDRRYALPIAPLPESRGNG